MKSPVCVNRGCTGVFTFVALAILAAGACTKTALESPPGDEDASTTGSGGARVARSGAGGAVVPSGAGGAKGLGGIPTSSGGSGGTGKPATGGMAGSALALGGSPGWGGFPLGAGGTTSGTSPLGGLAVSPAMLDFGAIDVGAKSTPQVVTVTAKNGVSVSLNLAVAGAGFAIAATTCPNVMSSGSCTISIAFAPTMVGAAAGPLTAGTASVPLSGIGTMPSTFTAIDRIDLGTLRVNAPAPVNVQIAPQGTLASLTCAASGIDLTLASQTCPMPGPVSAPCIFTFMFKAVTAGAKSEFVICSGGGKTTQTTITATVVTPASLSISPTSAAMSALVGKSDSVTLVVGNAGGSPSGLPSVLLSGDTGSFAITSSDCVVPLAPLGVCKVQVSFAPIVAGTYTARLTVNESQGTPSASAAITGYAVMLDGGVPDASLGE
jgi:hypothetical protein